MACRPKGFSKTRSQRAVLGLVLGGLVFCLTSRERIRGDSQAEVGTGANAVLCRALEVRTLPRQNLTLVIFHQARELDGSRLGRLLRANDGGRAEFQSEGQWRSATVLRLGSCFGRGLLIFQSNAGALEKREQFLVRFLHPSAKTSGN